MGPESLHCTLTFFHEAEGLKKLLRHSWLSDGRQESVAEHTWRTALMAMTIGPDLGVPINMERTLRMIIVHDLGEVFAGDHHAFNDIPLNQQEKERSGLERILRNLPDNKRTDMLSLWEEFENGQSPEAKLAKALDKLEVLIQHNEADIATWNDNEHSFNLVYGDEHCQYDDLVCRLREAIREETRVKVENARKSHKLML